MPPPRVHVHPDDVPPPPLVAVAGHDPRVLELAVVGVAPGAGVVTQEALETVAVTRKVKLPMNRNPLI